MQDGLLEDAEAIFYLRIEEVRTALRGAMSVETVRPSERAAPPGAPA